MRQYYESGGDNMIIDIYKDQPRKYNIIYADPPWSYRDSGMPGGAEQHYHTMSIDDIKALPIQNIAADDCILFIWATFPLLQEALDVITSWGFTYKTIGFTWVKHNKRNIGWFYGTGSYTRSNAEVCLIATKGDKLPRKDMGICSVIDTPIQEHSKKPDIVRRQIVKLMGDLPRIELFARREYSGWDSFGNEL